MTAFVPMSFLDFLSVGDDFASDVFGTESEHEGIGKRPRLARDIPEVADLNADFFLDLSLDGLLERFSWIHKAGEYAEHAWTKIVIMGEQKFVASSHRDDHRGRD